MIDLHLHTRHSDGADSVEDLLINAEKLNLEVISITDHDTIGAYKEIENNKDYNVSTLFDNFDITANSLIDRVINYSFPADDVYETYLGYKVFLTK